jgi:DNA-directed RNA polymerase subunit M/transcription elongation factor TFIIS
VTFFFFLLFLLTQLIIQFKMTDLERRTRALKLLRGICPIARDAWDLEASIFEICATSGLNSENDVKVCDYEAKVRQMAWNLIQSPGLLRKYGSTTLVHLDNKTLAKGTKVEAWYQEHELNMKRQHVLLHEEHKVQQDSGALMCNNCHSHDVEVHQKQTRSADEGMTVFCECSKCGTRWRM